MPLSIESTELDNKDYSFNGSQAQAKAKLKELQRKISYEDGALKPGTLRLVRNWDGSVEIKRREWYQVWNFVGWGRDTGRAKLFVDSLLQKAQEAESNDGSAAAAPSEKTSDESTLAILQNSLRKNLTNYLKEKSTVTTHGLGALLKVPTLSNYQPVKNKNNISDFLQSVGITRGELIGEGGFGTVCHAKIAGQTGEYIIKEEKEPKWVPLAATSCREGLDWEKRGDLAASCVKELKHVTKPLFLIVAVKEPTALTITRYYVPTIQATQFRTDISRSTPNAEVALEGQVMERVLGNELFDLLPEAEEKKGVAKLDFSPSSSHFKNVFNMLLEHFIEAHENNYIHRDIKPGNIVYNPKTGIAKLIDGGLAAAGSTNRKGVFWKPDGTPGYVSQKIVNRKSSEEKYSSGVDAHSIAITALAMINLRECYTYQDTTVSKEGVIKAKKIATNLDQYLDLKSSRQTKATLDENANKKVKELLELLFQVGQDDTKSAKAFESLKTKHTEWRQANGPFPLTTKTE